MSRSVKKDTWVEIHRNVLASGERAPQVPADTRGVPLELTARGFLCDDATVGDEVEIVTAADRRVRGVLTVVNPSYAHGFGLPIPELAPIGSELRAILAEK